MPLHLLRKGALIARSASFVTMIPLAAALAQHPMPMDSTAAARSMSGPLGISMDRMGSGTTWIPDAVPLPSRHAMAGKWELMLHGFVFLQNNWQDGPRGDTQFGSLNWAMLMASRQLGAGRFQARTMLSLDPATVTAQGYPLLLQSGESYGGEPLRDRQHPHDFWMELGALYEWPINGRVGLSLYAAPSGEPALGPVAFMHRPSAMDNPFAPLGHHWQDATHIAFGVLTAGIFTRSWKLEGSLFNGREPNEHRWDFDELRLDSYSGRLTYNVNPEWSLSAGYGFLDSPEAHEPDQSLRRLTASALHSRQLGANGSVASALVYGRNSAAGQHASSLLLESEAIMGSNTVLGRLEFIQKDAEDLGVTEPPLSFPDERLFNVSAVSLGYMREIVRLGGATVGIGGTGTMNIVPSALEATYGSRTPLGGVVFLRVRPTHERRAAMPGMHEMNEHAVHRAP